jgi:hypothetical protein
MSKKELLISLVAAAATSPSNAGMIDKIYDSIPYSIKESFGYTTTPLGITGQNEIYDASKPHRYYVPNTDRGILGDSVTHGLVHGSTITPRACDQPEEPLERTWPVAPYDDLRQLNHKSRGAQLSKDAGTNPVAATNLMRSESDIENLHLKYKRMAKKSRNNRQAQIKGQFKRHSKKPKKSGMGKSYKKKSKKSKKTKKPKK